MEQAGIQWFEDLKAFAAECEARDPLPPRTGLSAESEIQCRIIGGSLIAWLRHHGPALLQDRAIALMEDSSEEVSQPFIVFTSNTPGLVAAREILADASTGIVALDHQQYKEWIRHHPDDELQWHVHVWSMFVEPDAEVLQRAAEYPLQPGEVYWLHNEGTICAPLFGRGGDSLWKWNGQEPELLEEGFNTWIS